MPAGRSEYDLIIAVHALDDAYKELIRTINQVDEMRVQEPRMVTISLVNRGITSAARTRRRESGKLAPSLLPTLTHFISAVHFGSLHARK
jgi:hypothetical protein